MSPSPGHVLQFLAPSGLEEPAARSEGQFQPDPVPREQVEVYPEAGTWDLVMAGIGTALLGGGVLFLLLTVSGGRWKSPPPAAEMPLLKGRGLPFFLSLWRKQQCPGCDELLSSHAALYALVVTSPGGAQPSAGWARDRRCTRSLCRALPMPRLCSGHRS